MKKINLLIIIGGLLFSCSKSGNGSEGDDKPGTPPPENHAPSAVSSLTYPTNNLLCITNVLDFKWEASTDPDGDSVSYLLEISKNNAFSTIDNSYDVSTTSKMVTLEKEVAYYWRVKAIDSKNLSSEYSTTYQFYTEGVGETNHLPFSPKLIAPAIDENVSGVSINLEWSGSDVDNDPLTYDVYFDTVNPPVTKVGDNQTAESLNVNINTATTYYWQIVSKDTNSGQAIGQVWSFSAN
ncbi:hypothetical protein CLV91_2019 [Maribacter vaceletii]|uniref:Fibronectin type-III domain-containing protein n=1 Tax=Maribacter vaceletii TaxID=1206816 RepID=A0A495E8P3_9FLAO|nr:hypothetical protein [Maribacter vaceletii]RKR13302.1 hypothetical protein CLV91_2019 [Maribacter vaceletii]